MYLLCQSVIQSADKLQNMYHQQSLITLDNFYEWKPLSKLEALLSFIDYTLLGEYFKLDSHRRGPKGYSKKQLFNTLISMQIEQFAEWTYTKVLYDGRRLR